MTKRRLGSSDLEITPVVLGAWALGGSMWGGQDDADALAAIHASLDAGVTCIDTAPVYGLGKSEELIGRALEGRRDKVILASKCGLIWDRPTEGTLKFQLTDVDGTVRPVHHDMSAAAVRRGCEDSLRLLRTDYIDLFQIHWPDPAHTTEAMFDELLKLRAEGKIRWIGVSNFSADQLAVAKQIGSIVSDQPQYNLLERDIEDQILPLCRRENIGVLVYSPMARGLLTGKYGPDHQFPANDHRSKWFQDQLRPQVLAALEQARAMASDYGVTLGNLAVAWTLSQPGITGALVGARNAAQATENAHAGAVRLSPSDAQTLATSFSFKA